ncbi:hypothetical protein ABW19_dt0200086 [Dactylella cylindrospora]|nr:hypothetical protein ABW19_dt0200086 [Dactylella cylindrospora]
MASEDECCTGFSYSLGRLSRQICAFSLDRYIYKDVDFSYSNCNPHPYPHPEDDRLEHCYKYGHGDGKFLPVLIGDRLGKYEVKAKLGHGNFASVWQAEPVNGQGPSVAVKCCTNSKKDSKDDVNEAKTLHKLKRVSDGKGDFGKKHTLLIEESFRTPGHFGDHFCIVTPAIGPSLDYYFNLTQKQGLGAFDYQVAKKTIFQVMASVFWLHKAGYAHGDIHPHNILMKEEGFKAGKNAKRYLSPGNTKPKDIPYMPEYLVACVDDDLTAREPLTLETTDARLADFGQTFKKNHPRRKYKMTTPKGNRSPEWALVNTPITQSIDIWSVACITYRMVTGKHLMFVEERHKDEKGAYTQKRTKHEINIDHMPMMVKLLGPPPSYLRGNWKKSGLPPMDWDLVDQVGNLHERIMQDKPASVSDKEVAVFEDFLRKIFVWDYRHRATAKELIQHEWFKSILTPEDEAALQLLLGPEKSKFGKLFQKGCNKLSFLCDKLFSLGVKKIELEAESTTFEKSAPILPAITIESLEDSLAPF